MRRIGGGGGEKKLEEPSGGGGGGGLKVCGTATSSSLVGQRPVLKGGGRGGKVGHREYKYT